MFEKIGGHTLYTPALRPNSTVLDLGANHGRFARAMQERFKVISHLVEANPVLAAELSAQGEFPVSNFAVTSKPGHIPFNIACNDEGSSILKLPDESVYNCVLDRTVSVPAKSLDLVCQDLDQEQIDLVKMDIEGAEIEVLEAVTHATLQRIAQLTIEFHCDESFGFGMADRVHKIIKRMQHHQFVCLKFSPSLVDVLFLNRQLLSIPQWRAKFWEVRENPPAWIKSAWSYTPQWLKRVTRNMIPSTRPPSAK